MMGAVGAALLSCGLMAPQASAIPITGAITFAGGAILDTPDATSATSATFLNPVAVISKSGSFVTAGATATFANPFIFESGAVAGFWTSLPFTFDLISSTVTTRTATGLIVNGVGTVTAAGFDPTPGIFAFSTQDPSAGGVFSFSASTDTRGGVPDGGLTITLLGLSMVSLVGLRNKFAKV